MAHFEKLQDLWQRQGQAPDTRVDAERLMRSVQAYGRRQLYVNATKTLLIAAVLGWGASGVRASARGIAGLALVGCTAAILLLREWRMQRAISRLEFGAPSLGFVRSTMDRLYDHRDAHRRMYWPFMAVVVVGVNLMISGAARWWMRALASSLPFVAFELGMWVRRKRFELECRPLLDRLSAMRSALEERGE
jgi:hypothetical protein